MSAGGHRLRGAPALILAALALAACGDGSSPAADASPRQLAPSVEAQAAAFLEREGTAVRRSLRRFLGPKLNTKVERGATICRRGAEVASIADPRRYPFACIVRAGADAEGLEVGIVLGFVGTELEGRCWRAANERIAVTTTVPALLSRREAKRPVNQLEGCV